MHGSGGKVDINGANAIIALQARALHDIVAFRVGRSEVSFKSNIFHKVDVIAQPSQSLRPPFFINACKTAIMPVSKMPLLYHLFISRHSILQIKEFEMMRVVLKRTDDLRRRRYLLEPSARLCSNDLHAQPPATFRYRLLRLPTQCLAPVANWSPRRPEATGSSAQSGRSAQPPF